MELDADDSQNDLRTPVSPRSGRNPKASGWAQLLGPKGRRMKASGVPKHVREEPNSLSQLSDLSEAAELASIELRNKDAAAQLSQEGYHEQTQLPSQPDIPLPVFVPDRTYDTQAPARVAEVPRVSSRSNGRAKDGVGPGVSPPKPTRFVPVVQQDEPPPPAPKSKATRRGPMDEMRQLVRILVKVIPQSLEKIGIAEEGGGGNRISEEQIKSYLENTLGEAPRPPWGIPQGWGKYLADLLTWVTGRPITSEQAKKCAKREPGRSWEALPEELHKLGVYPSTWMLPLSRAGLRDIEAGNPVLPVVNGTKRQLDGDPKLLPPKKRAWIADPSQMNEPECWQAVCQLLRAIAGMQEGNEQSGASWSPGFLEAHELLAQIWGLRVAQGATPPPVSGGLRQMLVALSIHELWPSILQQLQAYTLNHPNFQQLLTQGVANGPGQEGEWQGSGAPFSSTHLFAGMPILGSEDVGFGDLSQPFGLSQLVLSQPVGSKPGTAEGSAFQPVKPAEPRENGATESGSFKVIKPQPTRPLLGSPPAMLPVSALTGLGPASPPALLYPLLFPNSQIDPRELGSLPKDDFPVVSSQVSDEGGKSPSTSTERATPDAVQGVASDVAGGGNLYRPQPLKPDQAHSRKVDGSRLSGAPIIQGGFQALVSSTSPICTSNRGAFRRPGSQDSAGGHFQKGQGCENGAAETSPGVAERDPQAVGTVAGGSTVGDGHGVAEEHPTADGCIPADPNDLPMVHNDISQHDGTGELHSLHRSRRRKKLVQVICHVLYSNFLTALTCVTDPTPVKLPVLYWDVAHQRQPFQLAMLGPR